MQERHRGRSLQRCKVDVEHGNHRAKKNRRGGLSATGNSLKRRSKSLAYTSSLRAPIKVRRRSASRATSNGFLNVSLIVERSKLVELPSSGNKAIRIVSA